MKKTLFALSLLVVLVVVVASYIYQLAPENSYPGQCTLAVEFNLTAETAGPDNTVGKATVFSFGTTEVTFSVKNGIVTLTSDSRDELLGFMSEVEEKTTFLEEGFASRGADLKIDTFDPFSVLDRFIHVQNWWITCHLESPITISVEVSTGGQHTTEGGVLLPSITDPLVSVLVPHFNYEATKIIDRSREFSCTTMAWALPVYGRTYLYHLPEFNPSVLENFFFEISSDSVGKVYDSRLAELLIKQGDVYELNKTGDVVSATVFGQTYRSVRCGGELPAGALKFGEGALWPSDEYPVYIWKVSDRAMAFGTPSDGILNFSPLSFSAWDDGQIMISIEHGIQHYKEGKLSNTWALEVGTYAVAHLDHIRFFSFDIMDGHADLYVYAREVEVNPFGR